VIQFRPDNRENHRLSIYRSDHLYFPIQLTTLPKVDPKQITDYQAKYLAYELSRALSETINNFYVNRGAPTFIGESQASLGPGFDHE
jgi:hypothetical protein